MSLHLGAEDPPLGGQAQVGQTVGGFSFIHLVSDPNSLSIIRALQLF